LRERVHRELDSIKSRVEQRAAYFQEQRETAIAFKQRVVTSMNAMRDFVDVVEPVWGLISALRGSSTSPDFVRRLMGQVRENNFVLAPRLSPEPNIQPDVIVNNMAAATSAAFNVFQDNFRSALAFPNLNISTANLAFPQSVRIAPPDNYNPPDVSLAAAYNEQQRHQQVSFNFMQDMSVLVGLIDQANRYSNRSTSSNVPTVNTNISASRLANAMDNMGWFGYQNLDDAGMLSHFNWLLDPLRTITSMLSRLDILWRILQTIKIFRRFWGRSSLAVRPVDVTTDKESKSRAGKVLSPMQATAVLLTHPLILFSVSVVFFIIIFGTVFTLYMPSYTSYQRECVATNAYGFPTGDGTFLTRNAYAIAFNRATHEGNRLRLTGLDEYNQRRAETCARYGERSANEQQQVQSEMDVIVNSHERFQREIGIMWGCYQYLRFNQGIGSRPLVDRRGQPFGELDGPTMMGEPECRRDLNSSSLEDGVFNCHRLPECVIGDEYDLSDLNGIDHTELYAHSRTAMCTAQRWFHAHVQRIGFTIFIWIFVNLFRVLFLAGLIRLCWQHLNTGHFTFLATCETNGSHTYQQKDLKKKVYGMLYRLHIQGSALIGISLLTQIPWIVAVAWVAEESA